jgi:hypothetical protein
LPVLTFSRMRMVIMRAAESMNTSQVASLICDCGLAVSGCVGAAAIGPMRPLWPEA